MLAPPLTITVRLIDLNGLVCGELGCRKPPVAGLPAKTVTHHCHNSA